MSRFNMFDNDDDDTQDNAVDHVHLMLNNFANHVNNHPDMHVRMPSWNDPWQNRKGRKYPDHSWEYWAGVALSAYEREIITQDMFKDVLIALQAKGAKGKQFDMMIMLALKRT